MQTLQLILTGLILAASLIMLYHTIKKSSEDKRSRKKIELTGISMDLEKLKVGRQIKYVVTIKNCGRIDVYLKEVQFFIGEKCKIIEIENSLASGNSERISTILNKKPFVEYSRIFTAKVVDKLGDEWEKEITDTFDGF